MLHIGERVYWGAPEVIYLEGIIISLNEEKQIADVLIDRATPHSAHLLGSTVPFATDGIQPLVGESPPGVINEPTTERLPPPILTEAEKIERAAAVAVHQQYGYNLPATQEKVLIEQVTRALNSDPALRARILVSIDEILKREL